MENTTNTASKLMHIGAILIRYTLVVILIWVGFLHFVDYEASNIKGLVENSPLVSWGYNLMSVQGFSIFIGIIEILLGVLIATRPFAPKLSGIGSLGAIIMFLITLSFLLTTPGVSQEGHGFPFLSAMPGQFLAKDFMLLAAAIWTAGEALGASRQGERS